MTRIFIGKLSGYCDNQNCSVRQVEVWVKNFGDTPQATTLRCPACGDVLSHFRRQAADEVAEAEDRAARESVNRQRYERDHGPIVPASVLFDDTLPAERYER